MSAQKQEQLAALNEGQVQHAAHVGFTLLQGGMTSERPSYGEMPTPQRDATFDKQAAALPFDVPPFKFERGGSHTPHDIQL